MRTVMMSLLASLLFALPTLQSEAAPRTQATPQVVSYVELNRYTGLWYEIASNPTAFEVGCVGTTAQYTARPDGIIDVENQCYIRRIGGRGASPREQLRSSILRQMQSSMSPSAAPIHRAPVLETIGSLTSTATMDMPP